VLWQTGRADEAADALRAALAARPGYAEARYLLGSVRKQQGRLDEAIAEFREAIRVQPGLAEAHLSLGQSLQQKQDAAGAAAAFAEAQRLNQKKANAQAAQFALAAARERLARGDLDGALARLREAVRLAPGDAQAHRQLALALAKKGAAAEAASHLAQARRLAPWLGAEPAPQPAARPKARPAPESQEEK
jgi:tetratricopeptide (TPR) repeat protein